MQAPFESHSRTRRMTEKLTQLNKFKQGARDLETDDDEARFDERVKKLVKHKPVEKPL